MPTGTHKQTINTALGEVLHQLGREWTLRSEHVGRIFEEGGRPDILGRGAEEVKDLVYRVGHGQFDLVIMNPPFTRHGAREGDRTQVHNPAFAAFGANEEEQDRLSDRLSSVSEGGRAHGHAGLASFFAELAHRKLAAGGTLALVLPLSSMSGMSWEGIRQQWRSAYSSPIIVTIAEESSHTRSFSAMAVTSGASVLVR